ncbi:hypothetical protein BpHYR1_014356 [Brachionus plicatilis]|uniref:Uncharacterized protein n=1 Tax=Brachionus plicatilis TaxID=10195 RepID=A0A3M7QH67_BRAPC|nr:hypothetical protein BpHYR1_014356 [Brachionus plicatilis]
MLSKMILNTANCEFCTNLTESFCLSHNLDNSICILILSLKLIHLIILCKFYRAYLGGPGRSPGLGIRVLEKY